MLRPFSLAMVFTVVLVLSMQGSVSAAEPAYTANLPMQAMGSNPYLIADIAEDASPSIVFIEVQWPESNRNQPIDPFWDMLDPWFFSPMPRQRGPRTSAGTGFFIDESGIILTNQHVVGNMGDGQTITVTVSSPDLSGEFAATLIGADVTLDLAVLQIEGEDVGPFPVIPLGDSDAARPGELVIAIGNPYGRQFEQTVTVGVLSAKGREIVVPTREGTTRIYQNLMQTDAAINQGNSGGPLLNLRGEVIGINTAVHARAQGIGFAIPINVATEVLDELIATGRVAHQRPTHAWVGVWYVNVTEDLADRLNLTDTKGVVIFDVIQESPAQRAGLRAMDVVRRVEDVDIHSRDDFTKAIAGSSPGDELLLSIIRDGEPMFITLTLDQTPAASD